MILFGSMQPGLTSFMLGSVALLKACGRDVKEAASKAMWTQKWLVAMTLESTTAALICLIVFAVRKEWSRSTVCSLGTTTLTHFICRCISSPQPFSALMYDFELLLDSSDLLN